MAKFVVEFQYHVDREQRQTVHPAHADYLHSLAGRGVLLLAGPLVRENGGLLIYEEGYQKVPILFNLPRRASHRNNDPSRRMW